MPERRQPPESSPKGRQPDDGTLGPSTTGKRPAHSRLRAALEQAVLKDDTPPPIATGLEPVEEVRIDSRISGFCVSLLLVIVVIPGGQSQDLVPPWQQIFMPGSSTFIAAIFGFFLLSLQFREMDRYVRATWLLIIGSILTLLALFAVDSAVEGSQFGNQPAVGKIFGGGVAPAIAIILAIVPLAAALFWRSQDPGRVAPRVAISIGAGLTAFMYLGGHWVGISEDVPLLMGLDAVESSPFLGDRVAAGCACLPLLLAALSPLFMVEWKNVHRVSALGGLVFWLSCVLPGLVLALFVASTDAWYRTLEPLKMMLLIATGLLMLATGFGCLMASIDSKREP